MQKQPPLEVKHAAAAESRPTFALALANDATSFVAILQASFTPRLPMRGHTHWQQPVGLVGRACSPQPPGLAYVLFPLV